MAHYLESAGRDYLLLERSERVANFFHTNPRFRSLISINKWNVGQRHLDFNLRHDWNSLLSDPSHSLNGPQSGQPSWTARDSSLDTPVSKKLLFREWSKDLFPNANDLVGYMDYYAAHHKLKIAFNQSVLYVQKDKSIPNGNLGDTGGKFIVKTADGGEYHSDYVIIGAGLGAENQLPATVMGASGKMEPSGWDIADSYTSTSIDPEDYLNQKVLIVGRGNAAFEVGMCELTYLRLHESTSCHLSSVRSTPRRFLPIPIIYSRSGGSEHPRAHALRACGGAAEVE